MPLQSLNLLRSYRYDPLNRLISSTSSAQASAQRFYLKDRLTTEIQGTVQCSIMQHEDQLLAQQQRQGSTAVETSLLVTDQQRSVLNVLDASQSNPLAYTPYGHLPLGNGLLSLLGFNGERPDPVTGWYLLGNGYRAFNPVLMCFTSRDSWSPFGAGGLNAYAYCVRDPLNFKDSTGHSPLEGIVSALSEFSEKFILGPVGGLTRKPITNVKKIANDAYIFDDIYKQKPRFNIIAHGGPPFDGEIPYIVIDDIPISPKNLYNRLAQENVNLENYSNIRLLSCFSADTENSFALAFSKLTNNKPVKAFSGTVSASILPSFRKKTSIGATDTEAKTVGIFKNGGIVGRICQDYRPKKINHIRKT